MYLLGPGNTRIWTDSNRNFTLRDYGRLEYGTPDVGWIVATAKRSRPAAPISLRSSVVAQGRTMSARRAAGVHLVLATPRCVFGVESHGGPETDPLAYGLFREHPELRDGHLIIGDRPGFGLDIDWAFVDKYRVRQWREPSFPPSSV